MTRSGLPRPDAVLLRLRLIGHMEALTLGNESVLPLGRKTRGLLAILALGGRKPVLRLRLAELLWSRRSEEQARASLRQEIHRLLEALSPVGTDVITVERHTLALKPALTSVDAERILTARPGNADGLPPIEGVLLEELNGTDPALDIWLAAERTRLRDHAIGLFEEMLGRQRDPYGRIDAARRLLALDGTHERAWLVTIQAQQALGNDALARQFGGRCLAALETGGIAKAGSALREVLLALRLDQEPDAPVYELAASGTEPQEPVDADRDCTQHARQEPSGLDRSDPIESRPQTAAGGQPHVAIVPVLVLDGSGDPGIAHFASGLVQALQAGLADSRWLAVLTGSDLQESLLHGRDDTVLRRRFGARYVVDGTLQRIGSDVRVILRLSDIVENGQLRWAQRFDGKADALLALQDLVAAQTTARLPAEITMAEAQKSRRRPESELDAQSLASLALLRLNDSDRTDTEQATQMALRGLEQAPTSPHLNMVLATAYLMSALQRWGDPDEQAERAERAARDALVHDPSNARLMASCAYVSSELRNRPDAAMALVERSLSLMPHAAETWAVGACALVRLGRLDEAARFFETYKRLFATHPLQALLDLPEVMIPLLRGDNETATRLGLLHTELHPAYVPILVPYLAALGHLHQTGEAERIRTRLLQAWPDSTVDTLVHRAGLTDPAHADHLRTGLTLASLQTGPLQASPANDEAVLVAEQTANPPPTRRVPPPLGAEPLAG